MEQQLEQSESISISWRRLLAMLRLASDGGSPRIAGIDMMYVCKITPRKEGDDHYFYAVVILCDDAISPVVFNSLSKTSDYVIDRYADGHPAFTLSGKYTSEEEVLSAIDQAITQATTQAKKPI